MLRRNNKEVEIRNVGRIGDILVWPGKAFLRGKFGANPERYEKTTHLDVQRKRIPVSAK